MACIARTDYFDHMAAPEVDRVRIIRSEIGDPVVLNSGTVIQIANFWFELMDGPRGEHIFTVPYNVDRDEWVLEHARCGFLTPIEFYEEIMSAIARVDPYTIKTRATKGVDDDEMV